MKFIGLKNGSIHFVDDADYDVVVEAGPWHGIGEYANRYVVIDGVKQGQTLHRFIGDLMGLPEEIGIDHKDRNKSNCCRDNLRSATRSQNMQNRSRKMTSHSGYKGVWLLGDKGKWAAGISANGVQKHLGMFDDKIEAAKAYDQAATEYFGEFACLNFPNSAIELPEANFAFSVKQALRLYRREIIIDLAELIDKLDSFKCPKCKWTMLLVKSNFLVTLHNGGLMCRRCNPDFALNTADDGSYRRCLTCNRILLIDQKRPTGEYCSIECKRSKA